MLEARREKAELQKVIDKLRREAEERERVLAERERRFVTLRDENLRLEACREVRHLTPTPTLTLTLTCASRPAARCVT